MRRERQAAESGDEIDPLLPPRPPVGPKRMMANAGLLTTGQIVSTAAIFFRNLVIVRTLTKAEYGVATTFGIALTVVTTLGNMNVELLVVQAKDGEVDRFQRTGQLIRFGQGMLLAMVLYFGAPGIAALFSLEGLTDSYRILAVAPLMNAFLHFDSKRFLRDARFGPEVLTESGSQLIALALVACLAPFFPDYRLMIWGLLAQFTGMTLITHLVARRRYGWSVDGRYLRRLLVFGWPLLLSGFFMMAASQGERLIVGASERLTELASGWLGTGASGVAFTKEDLAAYALGLGLVMVPTLFFAKVVPKMWFPLLAARQDDIHGFHRQYSVMAGLSAVSAATIVAVLGIAGEPIIVAIYTDRYTGVGSLMAVLVVGQAFRMMRYVPTTGALAYARTRIALWAHVMRTIAVVFALVAAIRGAGLVWIAGCAAVGELVALALAAQLFHRHPSHSPRLLARPMVFLGVWIGVSILTRYVVGGETVAWTIGAACLVAAGVVGSAFLVFPFVLEGAREVLAMRRRG